MKKSQLSALLVLLFAANAVYSAGTILIEQDYNGNPLGVGYDASNRQLLAKCLKTDVSHVARSYSDTKIDVNYIQQSRLSELDSQYRGNFAGSINLGIVAGYGKYEKQLDHSVTGSRDSLSINITYGSHTEYIKHYELNQTGLDALDVSDAHFKTVCGEHMLSGIKHGVSIQLTAMLQYKNKKEYEFTKKIIGGSALLGMIKKEKKDVDIINRLGINARLYIKILSNGFESDYLKQLLDRDTLETSMVFSCELEAVDDCINKFNDLLDYFTYANKGRSIFVDLDKENYPPLHYVFESYHDSAVFSDNRLAVDHVYLNAIPLSELNAHLQQLIYRKIYYVSNNQLEVVDADFTVNMARFASLHQQIKETINYCSSQSNGCKNKTNELIADLNVHYANIGGP